MGFRSVGVGLIFALLGCTTVSKTVVIGANQRQALMTIEAWDGVMSDDVLPLICFLEKNKPTDVSCVTLETYVNAMRARAQAEAEQEAAERKARGAREL